MAAMTQELVMTQRTRKLLGTFGLLALVVVYSIVVGAIYANFLGGQALWLLIVFFAIAGMGWFFPATWIIRWMSKPDA
jgi:hypothetical protein